MVDAEPTEKPTTERKPWHFTAETAKEMQERSVIKRMRFQTPERRKFIARRAAKRRWYNPSDDALMRVMTMLRVLAIGVADAMMEDDHAEIRLGIGSMLAWEKLRIALETGAMKDVTPEISAEIEGKLAKARERRDAALSEPVETSATNAADPDHIPDKTP